MSPTHVTTMLSMVGGDPQLEESELTTSFNVENILSLDCLIIQPWAHHPPDELLKWPNPIRGKHVYNFRLRVEIKKKKKFV